MMTEGMVSARTEGTLQGGPLSPLLSNILLTDLDRELERRGHPFCRYADDCNIYVKSEMAGEQAMDVMTRLPGEETEASGQSGQECRRAALAAEASGV